MTNSPLFVIHIYTVQISIINTYVKTNNKQFGKLDPILCANKLCNGCVDQYE